MRKEKANLVDERERTGVRSISIIADPMMQTKTRTNRLSNHRNEAAHEAHTANLSRITAEALTRSVRFRCDALWHMLSICSSLGGPSVDILVVVDREVMAVQILKANAHSALSI